VIIDGDHHDEPPQHYFAEHPDTASHPVVIDVTLPDTAFALETDHGVFARSRLDTGTSLLLRTASPLPAVGDLLDLGCGAGPIAIAMARRSPAATVWAIDVNERARELCAANAVRNEIDNIRVLAPDDVPEVVRFAAIWSNPPIRIGKQSLHRLLERWLDRLDANASATLVVQKHLGADSLQRWLADRGHHTERVASKAGFRVITASARGSGL
jgi:16S rRNA (guanine1207-N2)-methyltransferase